MEDFFDGKIVLPKREAAVAASAASGILTRLCVEELLVVAGACEERVPDAGFGHGHLKSKGTPQLTGRRLKVLRS